MSKKNKEFTEGELLELLKIANSTIRDLKNKNSQLTDICTQAYIDLDRSEQRTLELEAIVGKDELSGLLNRRAFNEKKTIESEEIIAMIDLDNFKHINDRYGHVVGDEIISNMGNIIDDTVYPIDLSFRYGGDEFIIIFRNCPYDKAIEKLQIIANKYQNMCNNIIKADFTLSFGVYSPSKEVSTIKGLNIADKQMYSRKRWKKLENGVYRGIRERGQR